MQLDGYCEALRIAFEFQGEYHYNPDCYFNVKGNASFSKRQEDDNRKRELCRERGILLFEIPFQILVGASLDEKVSNLRQFITIESKEMAIILPSNIEYVTLEADKIYLNNKSEQIDSIVFSKGGVLLEGKYEGAKSVFTIKCQEGHVWNARLDHLMRGVWCPACSGNTRLSLDGLRAIAAQREGQCLAVEYVNNRTKVRWRCKHGHEWEATAAHIKSGTWCPTCSNNEVKSIETFQMLAIGRNGQCLSSEYINIHTKLEWCCEKGHRWMATPNSIQRGSWCPMCYKLKKRS